MRRMPMRNGDEHDALTRWRRFIRWRKGELRRIKRTYRRAERRWLRRALKQETDL